MVTPLTLATWSFAGRRGPFGGALDGADVERSFHELGIRSFLVTPKMKALAEGVRRLIRVGHRDEITLISLAGIPTPGRVRGYWRRFARALETERMDVFLMGWVQHPWYLRRAVWHQMQQLKAEGKVSALGFSIHNRPLAGRLANELEPRPDVLMVRYNAAHRGAESDIFDRLPTPRPGIIAYTATRWGELLQPRPDQGYERGLSAPDCYRFTLSHPAVDSVMCAARTWEELREDVEAVEEGALSEERLREVRRFGDAVHARPRIRGSRFTFDRR